MCGGIIRVLIWIVASVLLWRSLKRSMIKKHKLQIMLFILFELLLPVVLYCWWFENLFVTFSSPEAVYHYTKVGEIDSIIEGEVSDLVISWNADKSRDYTIVKKNIDGWKISPFFKQRTVDQKYAEHILLSVEHYDNSQDYYVIVMYTGANLIKIEDNRGSSFAASLDADGKSYTYFAYVEDYNEQYQIFINGELIN